MNLTNWAGNLTYNAQNLICPRSIAEVRSAVSNAESLRVLGSKHSFNEIADTQGTLLSLHELAAGAEISDDRTTVSVDGATTYGELSRYLHERGYALRNLASLPHISVAGACATATHGSGVGNQNLAASVASMEFVLPSGKPAHASREIDGDRFQGMIVHLGSLGIVTSLELDIVPTYQIAQTVYDRLPMEALRSHFDEIMASAYSVSLFTTWQADHIDQVWVKRLVGDGESPAPASELFGATPATSPRHPIGDVSAVNCTQQLGVPGPWHERLPHFRYEHTPSHGEELQTEYFVAREDALNAIEAVAALRDQIAPLLLITEIRAVAADTLWMSPNYKRDSIGIHFTWKPEWPSVKQLLPQIEQRLAPFHPRPHWAKLFTMPGEQVQRCYPKLPDFRQLAQVFDPTGKLRNSYMSATLG